MNTEKEKWVKEVLLSAENIQRAETGKEFYRKTLNRIKAEANLSTDYVLRIAAGLLLIVVLNIFACVSFSKNKNTNPNQPLEAFAREYAIAPSNDIF